MAISLRGPNGVIVEVTVDGQLQTYGQSWFPVGSTFQLGHNPDLIAGVDASNIVRLLSVDPQGKVNVNVVGTIPVSGFPAVQAISAASLPLPIGASTETTLAIVQNVLQAFLATFQSVVGIPGNVTPQLTNQVGGTDGTNLQTLWVVPKGSPGKYGVITQNFKDTGRTYITFNIDAIAGVTSEALATFTINKGGGALASSNTYTVTAGKTLRITSISATTKALSTTAVFGRVRVRSGTTVTPTSGILLNADIPALTGTAIAGSGNNVSYTVPDGIEVSGGQQIGISQVVNSASSTVSVHVVGYEY